MTSSQTSMTSLLPSLNKYIPITPTTKQWAGLSLQEYLEVFYGGAAGGGKTDWLLAEAFLYADVPGYSAMLFRESYPNLSHEPDGLIPRSHKWLRNTDAKWAGSTKTWHFPAGATVSFGYLFKPDDHNRYAGPSFQMIGFDEATEIRGRSYQFMFSRLRRLKTASHLPLRIRAASNPGGRSHGFFRDRFNLAAGGPDERMRREQGRVYIPAYVSDNPYLDIESYTESLNQLTPTDRERLLRGDWSVSDTGFVFQAFWFEMVPDFPHEATQVRYWDMAGTEPVPGTDPDWTVGLRMALLDGVAYVVDIQRIRATAHRVEQLIAHTAERDGPGVDVVIEQEPGSAGKAIIDHYRRTALQGYRVRADKTSGSKLARAIPVANAAEAGNVKVLSAPWNDALFSELAEFTGTSKDGHDDQVDALSGAYRHLTSRRKWGAT